MEFQFPKILVLFPKLHFRDKFFWQPPSLSPNSLILNIFIWRPGVYFISSGPASSCLVCIGKDVTHLYSFRFFLHLLPVSRYLLSSFCVASPVLSVIMVGVREQQSIISSTNIDNASHLFKFTATTISLQCLHLMLVSHCPISLLGS